MQGGGHQIQEGTRAAVDRPEHRTTRHRAALAAVVAGAVGLLAACTPTPPPGGSGTRYIDMVFPSAASTTVTYASAPDLTSGQVVDLGADLRLPAGDTEIDRPAIVWIHGGGFRAGTRAATSAVADAYARRGYVTLSIDYRLDPASRCQDVQDGVITDPVEAAAEADRCQVAVDAAQHDAQAAIRWLRANAASYGVDPAKIVAGGFSAGAVTALNAGQRSDQPGAVGDHLDRSSAVAAVLAASGFNTDMTTIDADDPPLSLLASELDPAAPFTKTVQTGQTAEGFGTTVQELYHMGNGLHAAKLYQAFQGETDTAWCSFLVAELGLA